MNESIIVDREQLTEALQYCLHYCGQYRVVSPVENEIASCLRSPFLAGSALSVLPEYFRESHASYHSTLVDVVLNPDVLFERFLNERRHIVLRSGKQFSFSRDELNTELRRPRTLLLTDYEASLSCGTAEVETRGFLDVNNRRY